MLSCSSVARLANDGGRLDVGVGLCEEEDHIRQVERAVVIEGAEGRGRTATRTATRSDPPLLALALGGNRAPSSSSTVTCSLRNRSGDSSRRRLLTVGTLATPGAAYPV